MIRASKSDRKLVVELLTQSFKDNQSVNYIIQQDRHRFQRIRALMHYSIEVCLLFGDVWLSQDKKACALILYPQLKKTTLRSLWLDVTLIFQAIGVGSIAKAIKREKRIKEKQTKNPMAYLWFIGVDPLYQGSGIGSRLLKEVIAHAEAKGLPIYLETSTERNLPWYQDFGFRIYDKLHLDYVLYFLKHEETKNIV
ncbi:GNAT family N-acetyltransferase [Sphingobacterium sp. JB170]|uniref:GNAT family N-acetyltransferase n=1 Tax=Sphingobacterium sp. JB170 TaxID=1434842 RepID=UPI00097EEA05|nr:GNAT family N-acetyltransferase [Sphingobacterium sp. JB170]SJN36716.1 Puromycin N-acetyltransferase [Sphingobacterium sp. JB170]